ncbi:MAG TPA: CvpA family protein [Anaeromyxobacteraceae bacterium]|nr:CvpA family protein [Anaeromyxobacteraceae bacterium]
MTLDLACLAVLVLAALGGAFSGALRQLLQLAAGAAAFFASRALGPTLSLALARYLPPRAAGPLARLGLFVTVLVLVTLLGRLLLRGLFGEALRGPGDRAAGALLSAAKGALVLWAALSALALYGRPVSLGGVSLDPASSDFAAVAREHNLLDETRLPQVMQRLGGEAGPDDEGGDAAAVRRALSR